jgi:hypothetical protein
MSQQQKQKARESETRSVSVVDKTAAEQAFQKAFSNALAVLLLVLGTVAFFALRKFGPIESHKDLIQHLKPIVFYIFVCVFLARLYATAACKSKGVSLARTESTTLRRKPMTDMTTLYPFRIGAANGVDRISGLLGMALFTVLTLGLTIAIGSELLRHPSIWMLILSLFFVSLPIAGFVWALTTFRSGGERIRVTPDGVSWVQLGKRHSIPWTKLARVAVTKGYDTVGNVIHLKLQFFDNEDESLGTTIFNNERGPTFLPIIPGQGDVWRLARFYTQLEAQFDPPIDPTNR